MSHWTKILAKSPIFQKVINIKFIELQRIKDLEDLIVNSVTKIEAQ